MQKKHLIVFSILSASLALPVAGFADDAPAPAPVAVSGELPAAAPAERVEQLAAQVADLTADQKKQLEAIYASSAVALAAVRANDKLPPAEVQLQASRLETATRPQIEAVLTAPQRTQWRDALAKAGITIEPQPLNSRQLRRYTAVLPDLTDDQKYQILAVAASAIPRYETMRNNLELDEDERFNGLVRITEETNAKTVEVFTEPQRAKWQALQAEQRRKQAEREQHLKPNESADQKRARVFKSFEDAVPSLTPAQKDQLWPLLERENDISEDIRADQTRSDDQKQAILRRVYTSTDKKVAAILDKDQMALWQKARPAAPAK